MRITQGTFSFLPELTDEEIRAADRLCARPGLGLSVEYTDDPHPRNTYWEMWGLPMFDLRDGRRAAGSQRLPHDVAASTTSRSTRSTSVRGFETMRAARSSCNRPDDEPGFQPRAPGSDGGPAACATRRGRARDRPARAARGRLNARRTKRRACRPRRTPSASQRTGRAGRSTCARCCATRDIGRGARELDARARRPRAGEAAHPRDRRAAARGAARASRSGSRRARRRCTCASPATPAPARRPSRCAWPTSCTGSATCAKVTWCR